MGRLELPRKVQMIGTQRSGSNLLRLLLDQHSRIIAPPSAHELRDFLAIEDLYQSLADNEVLRTLVEDMCALVRANALQWPAPSLDANDVYECVLHKSVAGVVLALYDNAALKVKATAWVSKCLENATYADELLDASFGTILFLHLVRDPRDVALSFARAPIGPKDPTMIALRWQQDQLIAEDLRTRLPPTSWIAIAYEDLVASPQQALSPLLEILGLSWEPSMLEYHRVESTRQAATLSPLWENLGRQIDESRRSAFLSVLDEQSSFIQKVEETVISTMALYGYEPMVATGQVILDDDALYAAETRDQILQDKMRRESAARDDTVHTRRDLFLQGLRESRRHDGGK